MGSSAELAVAVSNAGGLGSLGCFDGLSTIWTDSSPSFGSEPVGRSPSIIWSPSSMKPRSL